MRVIKIGEKMVSLVKRPVDAGLSNPFPAWKIQEFIYIL
jgi:hypothetical protein